MADDDDCEFPDDWLGGGNDDEAAIEPEESLQAVEEDPAAETVEDAQDEEDDVAVEAVEDAQTDEIAVDDDDDDDLDAAEAAALAALGGPAKAPVGKAPLAKSPAGSLSGKGSSGKPQALPVGKQSAGKGSAQAAPWHKGGKQSPKGGKQNSAVNPGPIGQGATGAKAKGKGPKDGGVGHKVLALNKKGHWQTGRGISVQVLTALRELPQNEAMKILADLDRKGTSEQNPCKFIMGAIAAGKKGGAAAGGKATGTPPWRSGPAGAQAGKGVKRPTPTQPAGPPPAKRAAAFAPAGDDADAEELLEQMEPAVCKKVKEMQKSHEFGLEALRALGSAAEKDAMVLLQAFLTRVKAGKAPDLTRFIVKSLEARRSGAGQGPKAGAKAGVAKAPVIAKAPAKPAFRVRPEDIGKPPVVRSDLDFDKFVVQGKLQALNKMGIWEGSHPLDEATLGALLSIDPGRAIEILDEAEEKGAELKDPSDFVRTSIKENPR